MANVRMMGGLAAAVVVAAGAAAAQAPPVRVGMTGTPCEGAPVRPQWLVDYMAARYAGGTAAAPAPPAAELAAYQKAQADHATRDWPNLCRYSADNARLAAAPPAERRIVYLGDSITEGWGVAHPAFFTKGVVNRGISGQTTPQMLLRFQADVIALKPQAVHIMAGTNDLAGNTGPNAPQDFKNNIDAMATLARAHGIRVILASIPPTNSFAWAPGLKPGPQLRELNAWLKAYARRTGATYVDYFAPLATPQGDLRPVLTLDGVHPNRAGYEAMEPLAPH